MSATACQWVCLLIDLIIATHVMVRVLADIVQVLEVIRKAIENRIDMEIHCAFHRREYTVSEVSMLLASIKSLGSPFENLWHA